jgi:hypothetical protein
MLDLIGENYGHSLGQYPLQNFVIETHDVGLAFLVDGSRSSRQ